MNINRDNYEEYFLLYADKELSEDEKNLVEMFVQQNPDLEEEFIMLQQSVLKPDNSIALEDKSSLFRKEEFINQTNYEEMFLLYADNELSLSEIEETEKFVLSNPSLQKEFTLLQQVTYQPDTSIVFPDKSSLYKKEDDSKVIPFRWKALAAAVLLGIGLWTGITYLQKNKTEPVIVINQNTLPTNIPVKPEKQKHNDKNLVKRDNNQQQPLKIIHQKQFDNPIQKQQVQNIIVKNIQPNNKKAEVNENTDQKKEDFVVTNVPDKNELPKPVNNLPSQSSTPLELNHRAITKATVPQNNNYSQPASYIAGAEEKSENYVFYNITSEEFRKSKVGNFFKKIKRAIERKLPLKNGLKIGNVEIAKDDQN